ncbi:hypothetical protein K2173_001525 [Erythroxylum novogranatense]|uniref:Uncharacterized protein n=1 Tax=Erythroxylum novogranatense TaxID=1862640 RepID=A0AAV8T524_9ROSI|nr:hypothetical protein K2173_001525 [Erythroxylum novogranatense]
MCSNTSLTSGAGGYDGGRGRSGGYDGETVYPKKPKRPRVRRRGPGVAELEKMLREEKRIDKFDGTKDEGLSVVSPLSTSHQHQPKHLSPPQRKRLLAINGSRDNTFSTVWNPCESCIGLSPSNQSQFTVNFPNLSNQKSFPSSALSQGSQNHYLSAPSMMQGAKRSRTSLMEIPLPPPFPSPIPKVSTHNNPSMSSSTNNSTSQFNGTTSRGLKKTGDVNSLPSLIPETALTNTSHQHQLSNFSHSPFQEGMEVSSYRQQAKCSTYREPFGSILLSPEQIGMTDTSFKNGRGERIDLNLKL